MAKTTRKATTKRRVKKNVEHGQAHIQSSFNNTIVTLTDNARGQQGVCEGDTRPSRNSEPVPLTVLFISPDNPAF